LWLADTGSASFFPDILRAGRYQNPQHARRRNGDAHVSPHRCSPPFSMKLLLPFSMKLLLREASAIRCSETRSRAVGFRTDVPTDSKSCSPPNKPPKNGAKQISRAN
jgi:hypothetical protein